MLAILSGANWNFQGFPGRKMNASPLHICQDGFECSFQTFTPMVIAMYVGKS